jgi:hypothetical protein
MDFFEILKAAIIGVIEGITEWLPNWMRRGWKTADKKPVKNADLWQRLHELAGRHDVHWRRVKGHAGIDGNERADELANRGVESMIGAFTQTCTVTPDVSKHRRRQTKRDNVGNGVKLNAYLCGGLCHSCDAPVQHIEENCKANCDASMVKALRRTHQIRIWSSKHLERPKGCHHRKETHAYIGGREDGRD